MSNHDIGWNLDNSYALLPTTMFASATPVRVREPQLVVWNHRLAHQLGLEFSNSSLAELAQLCTGQTLPVGAQPIAQAYAGHQYGGFTMLGDGRAILMGEQLTPTGQRFDLQFKGSGPTRYSRRGDGRAALGPMLREYLISEAMAALGIPTTRCLGVALTGEVVHREQLTPGAVMLRVASSHIRVGTFQYAAARTDAGTQQAFLQYTVARHDPNLIDQPDQAINFFRQVLGRQARLIAQWQSVGFIHGVMNTDNMAISGETIDYGPCAFMNTYHPDTVYSSIDSGGRYAYDQQPFIANWNLARLAESLLTQFHEDQETAVAMATDVLKDFPIVYEQTRLEHFRAKLGLQAQHSDDAELVNDLLTWMKETKADFTNTFRNLPTLDVRGDELFSAWRLRWLARQRLENASPTEMVAFMNSANPAVIPRNHRVEEALSAAELQGNIEPFQKLLAVVQQPYTETTANLDYREPPASEAGYKTYCGT
jgi:serine/tyrosine/threonine adenylyltransferase